jgi:hypothetical protein
MQQPDETRDLISLIMELGERERLFSSVYQASLIWLSCRLPGTAGLVNCVYLAGSQSIRLYTCAYLFACLADCLAACAVVYATFIHCVGRLGVGWVCILCKVCTPSSPPQPGPLRAAAVAVPAGRGAG